MGPIVNHSYSAVGRTALVISGIKGVEMVTGKSKLALIALPLNYMIHYQFFKPMVPVEAQSLLSVTVVVYAGLYSILETLIQTKSFSNKDVKAEAGFHAMNEMVVLAAGVVVVVSAILTTDKNVRAQCVIATTFYGLGYAKKFYRETPFIHEVNQKFESSGSVPEFLVDETTRLQGKEVHYLVGRNEFEKLRTFLTLDIPLNNPLLLGEPGSGKTELIKFLAAEINYGRVEGCEGWRVFTTTCTAIIEGTKFIGTMQEKIGRMFRFF